MRGGRHRYRRLRELLVGQCDAIILEKQGIPAVAVVTEPFAPTAAAVAELNGMPGYPFVVVPHPFGSLDEAAVRSRADAALAWIERLLMGGPEER